MPVRDPNNLFLVGFMGSGKTTVGAILAKELGSTCLDTDEEISRRAKMTIPELFETKGEAKFREIEKEVVAEAKGIVSLGGGAFSPELLESGTCIFLRASVETLMMRLGNFDRPLFREVKKGRRRGFVETLLKEREASYLKCHHTVETDGKSAEAVAHEVKTLWKASK